MPLLPPEGQQAGPVTWPDSGCPSGGFGLQLRCHVCKSRRGHGDTPPRWQKSLQPPSQEGLPSRAAWRPRTGDKVPGKGSLDVEPAEDGPGDLRKRSRGPEQGRPWTASSPGTWQVGRPAQLKHPGRAWVGGGQADSHAVGSEGNVGGPAPPRGFPQRLLTLGRLLVQRTSWP